MRDAHLKKTSCAFGPEKKLHSTYNSGIRTSSFRTGEPLGQEGKCAGCSLSNWNIWFYSQKTLSQSTEPRSCDVSLHPHTYTIASLSCYTGRPIDGAVTTTDIGQIYIQRSSWVWACPPAEANPKWQHGPGAADSTGRRSGILCCTIHAVSLGVCSTHTQNQRCCTRDTPCVTCRGAGGWSGTSEEPGPPPRNRQSKATRGRC